MLMVVPPLSLVDVDYCDDAVVPVVAEAGALVSKCVDIVYVACAVFTSYGLVLNFGENKTNVMARFVRALLLLSANCFLVVMFGPLIFMERVSLCCLLMFISIWALNFLLLMILVRRFLPGLLL